MSFDPAWFGSKAEHVTLHQAQAEAERQALEQAKDVILPKLELAVVDGDGKRLKEREWRKMMRTVESL